MRLQARSTAVVAVDMHRGHLDPSVAVLPLAAERCGPVIARAAELFHELRSVGLRIIHVVTEYRKPEEIASNPFWKAIHDDPTRARKGILRHNLAGSQGTEIILEGGAEDAGRRVDPGKDQSVNPETTEQKLEVGCIKGAIALLASHHEIAIRIELGATNRDFRVVVASDAVDSMDGGEMHRFVLRLMETAVGWPLTNQEILESLKS